LLEAVLGLLCPRCLSRSERGGRLRPRPQSGDSPRGQSGYGSTTPF